MKRADRLLDGCERDECFIVVVVVVNISSLSQRVCATKMNAYCLALYSMVRIMRYMASGQISLFVSVLYTKISCEQTKK